jgi:FkbM family methyltransferase
LWQIFKLFSDVRAIARVSGTPAALAFSTALAVTFPQVLRSRNLGSADRRMIGRRWRFSLQGVTVELDGCLFGSAREMYCRQVYFPTADFNLNPGSTVMDLGADAGLFSLLAAQAGCTVIAVEAQGGLVEELKDLFSSHGLATSIVVENALVGSGTGVFSDPSALASAAHFDGSPPPRLSMSELLAKHHVDQLDFLKVDIEGSEFDLFQSGDQWLRRVRRIAMEVHTPFGSVEHLQRIIQAQGMLVELRDNDLRVVRTVPPPGGYLFARRPSDRRPDIA